jgi:hypothetical protein
VGAAAIFGFMGRSQMMENVFAMWKRKEQGSGWLRVVGRVVARVTVSGRFGDQAGRDFGMQWRS